MFSYGSGLASSLFSLKVMGPTSIIARNLDITSRLNNRTECTPVDYNYSMKQRETRYGASDYNPTALVSGKTLFKKAYYLEQVDEKYRRNYIRFQ